jgi:chitinase
MQYGWVGAFVLIVIYQIILKDNIYFYLQVKYIKNMGFGGAMAWTVDLDDFNNLCCREPFPLLRTINRILGSVPEQEPTRADCTKPPAPITPQPPTLTTGIDTGKFL